jgi:hypothetical protein
MPEKACSARFSLRGSLSQTMNFHGWELQAEGAWRAASRHRSSASRSTGAGLYIRLLYLVFARLRKSIGISPFGIFGESKRRFFSYIG